MKHWAQLIAAALVICVIAPVDAGKRKGAVTTVIDYDVATTFKGLSIKVAHGSDTYDLTVKKGKKKVVARSGMADTPWFEVVAFGKLVQVRGAINDVAVTVAPATKVGKKAISSSKARGIVEAEATQRGIDYNGSSTRRSSGNGVIFVALSLDGVLVVDAVVGARSKDLLLFDAAVMAEEPVVDPPVVEPPVVDSPVSDGGSLPAAFQDVLDGHNRHRADHCAPALTWSDELAATAQAWADQLRADGCAFEHSGSKYGENLAAGTSGALSADDVVTMWYVEIDHYDFASGGFAMDTGHFTQLVWKNTTKLGCGMAACGGMDIWVCNYDPPGNYAKQFAKNVLPTSCH